MSKHTITLSRAHKIAERLGQSAGEAKSQALALSGSVTLSGFTQPQVKRMQGNGAAALAQLALYTRLIGAQTAARTVIGSANEAHGVSAVLAQIEGNKKVLSALSAVASGQGADAVQLSELGEYKSVGNAETLRSSCIEVAMLDHGQAALLSEQTKALERRNFVLSDLLADTNARTVVIEMDDDLAALMGLVS